MKNYILIAVAVLVVYLLIKNKQAKDVLRQIAGNTQSILFSTTENLPSSFNLSNPVAGSGGTVIANAGTSLESQTISSASDQADNESSFQLV